MQPFCGTYKSHGCLDVQICHICVTPMTTKMTTTMTTKLITLTLAQSRGVTKYKVVCLYVEKPTQACPHIHLVSTCGIITFLNSHRLTTNQRSYIPLCTTPRHSITSLFTQDHTKQCTILGIVGHRRVYIYIHSIFLYPRHVCSQLQRHH